MYAIPARSAGMENTFGYLGGRVQGDLGQFVAEV